MIKTFILWLGLIIMFGVSFIPVTTTIKSDKKETLENVIREGMTAITFNIFMATLLILIKIGFK